MSQMGFYFNMKACVGCRACQVSCKDKNRLDVGMIYRRVDSFSVGSYPSVRAYYYAGTCNHCATPACMAVCPVGAILKLDDGTVVIDQEICIGCKSCLTACPYLVPQFDEATGVAGKCDACATLRAKGENPACMDTCPLRAIDFGEIDDLKAKYGTDLTNSIAILPSPDMTMPSLLIDAKDVAQDKGFKEMFL